MLYLSELDVRYSYTKHIGCFVLCYTHRNSVFVIPTLQISGICLFMSYLPEFGFRYSYIKHIGCCFVTALFTM
jgi:hypothetical protein